MPARRSVPTPAPAFVRCPASRCAAGLWTLVLSGLLAACSSTPPIRHYTLGGRDVPASAVSGGPSLVVGPVNVPERIDRLQVVRVVDGSRLEMTDGHRWAGPLKGELAARVAATLGRERGWSRVVAAPQTSLANPDLSLPIDVQRFEAQGFERVSLVAVWSLRRAGQELASGRFAASEPVSGGDYAALAEAHGRLADALARDIAARLPAH